MKITVFSDVHGNLEPLKKIFEIESDSDLYICLGDIVGYGPECNECLELISSYKNCIVLQGNHEQMVINHAPDAGCSAVAKDFFLAIISTS